MNARSKRIAISAMRILVVAMLYGLAAVAGIRLGALSEVGVSPVWPATGVAIALTYRWGLLMALGAGLGGLAFEIYMGAPAICKPLVERICEEIGVKSKLAEGSIFHFTMPY